MKALLLSGLAFPNRNSEIYLNMLANRISLLGIDCDVKPYDDPKLSNAYDIFIGHSLGGSRACSLATSKFYSVKYIGLIDPVQPRWWPIWRNNADKYFTMSLNVERADCFRRKFGLGEMLPFVNLALPPSSLILNPKTGTHRNFDEIRMSHGEAPRFPFVVDMILDSLAKLN